MRRRWVPWRRRIRDFGDLPSVPLPDGNDPFSALLMLLVLPFYLLVAIPALIIVILAVLEMVVLLTLTPVALAIRCLTGTWPIQVRGPGSRTEYVSTGGWQASRKLMEELSMDLRAGWDPRLTPHPRAARQAS